MDEIIAEFTVEQNEPLEAIFEAFDEPPIIGGTTDYNWLENKPSINDVTLIGNQSLDSLGIQAKGDYALNSDIPTLTSQLQNDSNFATQLDIMQAIAAIPQFKLSIVLELPITGEKMTLYLVPKEGTDNDVYNEYIWIEQTSTFEFLGTTAVDLTDYLTPSKLGISKVSDPMTEDEYNAIATKDPNTLYLIEE